MEATACGENTEKQEQILWFGVIIAAFLEVRFSMRCMKNKNFKKIDITMKTIRALQLIWHTLRLYVLVNSRELTNRKKTVESALVSELKITCMRSNCGARWELFGVSARFLNDKEHKSGTSADRDCNSWWSRQDRWLKTLACILVVAHIASIQAWQETRWAEEVTT